MIAIAAMARNRAIGFEGKIPWRIREELQFFKQTTMGHVLVMGRKTFESIGRPLPGRTTVVLSRGDFSHPEVTCLHSLDGLTPGKGQKIFIAGGAQIYALALPQCQEIILSVVRGEFAGDAFLPDFEKEFEPRERLVEHELFETWRWARKGRT